MLRQRSISAIFIVLSAVIPAALGHPVITVAVVALVMLGIVELIRAITPEGKVTAIAVPSAIVGSVIVAAVGFDASAPVIAAAVTLGVLLLLAIRLATGPIKGSTRDIMASVLPIVYVAIPLAHLLAIRALADHQPATWVSTLSGWSPLDNPAAGLAWLVLIVGVTWLTDTAAYLGGRSFGRHKLAPTLSPGKTIEGAASGVIFGVVSAVGFTALLGLPIPLYVAGVMGLILSVAAQIGDLVESLIKRDLGIKDMGNLIPGHGGILDRIDALLFTLPVGYYLIRVVLEVNWP
jgi:phosphatidate cytidylyltransferase